MEYFLSHLIYILIIGVVLGLIAYAAVVMKEKNDRDRGPDAPKCDFNCSACMSHYREQHNCTRPEESRS